MEQVRISLQGVVITLIILAILVFEVWLWVFNPFFASDSGASFLQWMHAIGAGMGIFGVICLWVEAVLRSNPSFTITLPNFKRKPKLPKAKVRK